MEYDYFYYQIDYIDKRGFANYISTFEQNELELAKEHLRILNKANRCLNEDTKFVLDKYGCIEETDYDEVVEQNITSEETILEYMERKYSKK